MHIKTPKNLTCIAYVWFNYMDAAGGRIRCLGGQQELSEERISVVLILVVSLPLATGIYIQYRLLIWNNGYRASHYEYSP